MTLEVIAAGLGRNGTLSMKFALEALGFGPCHHMTEVLTDGRRQIPLWLAAAEGQADWDAIFREFRSTSDYPSASYWRELTAAYPQAKVILTTRDPGSWCDSVRETIFSPDGRKALEGTPAGALMDATIFDHFDGDVNDRAFLSEWYTRRNRAVIEALPPDRLLQFHPREGWEPLCTFLCVPVPELPFPHVNSREALGSLPARRGTFAGNPEAHERFTRQYIEIMRQQAFKPPA